jgi:hypothetical protein
MSINYKNFISGVTLIPNVSDANSAVGDLNVVTSSNNYLYYHNGTTSKPVLTTDHQATVTNKNLVNNNVLFVDGTTSAKALKFDTSLAGSFTSTLQFNQSANQTINFQDAPLGDTVAYLNLSQNISNKNLLALGYAAFTANSKTVTLKASPIASANYDITLPAAAPLTNTALSWNGGAYVWSAAGGGGGLGDDIITSLFQGSFLDEFNEPKTDAGSAVATNSNATYVTDKTLYQVSYDASKFATTTGTAVVMTVAPSFTVVAGDVIFNGTQVRKIVTVTDQQNYVIESAFSPDLASAAVTISQAVNTVDIYNFSVNGNPLSSAFTSTFNEIMVDYEDTTAVNDNIFDINTTPVIAYVGSSDGTNYSALTVRPTLALSQVNTLTLPTSGTNLYLRFFANKTSGSGTVNILKYKAYVQRASPSGSNPLNYSYGYTNSSVTPVNATVGTSGGKTTITFNWTYALGVEPASPYGPIDVYLNGQLVPRYLTGVTVDAYYTELSSNSIQLDRDYSSVAVSFEVLKRVNVVYATASTSTSTAVGSGSKNYFTANNNNANPSFEAGIISPWTPVTLTLSSGIPTAVSSASASLMTLAATTASPLIGTYSGLLTKTGGSSAIGQGFISGPMTIDREDLAKVLYGSFSYEVVSGTVDFSGTSTQSLEIWIYNTVSGQWFQPAGYRGMNQTSGAGKVTFSFQTDSTPANNIYKVAIVTAQSDTNAYSVKFDDFSIGPTTLVLGAAFTDLTSYTPTFSASFGTVTGINMSWQREGDSLFVSGTFIPGTLTSATAVMSLPAGLSINTAKLSGVTTNQMVGYGSIALTIVGASKDAVVLVSPSTSLTNVYFSLNDYQSGNNALAPQSATGVFYSSTLTSISFRIPIQGWSSNVQMSNDTDTRVVDFVGSVGSGPAQVLTSNVTNVSVTTVKDSHGAWTGSTYVVPVSGDYVVAGSLATSAASQTPNIFKNATQVANASLGAAFSANFLGSGAIIIPNCVAGDILSIRSSSNGTVNQAYISINRLSGPSVIAATETVAAFGQNTAGQSIPNATVTTIQTPTIRDDSHGALSTSGTYTVPVSGRYFVSVSINFSSNGTGARQVFVYKNGAVTGIGTTSVPSSTGNVTGCACSGYIQALAGDTITMRAYQGSGGALALSTATDTSNTISINRVGN